MITSFRVAVSSLSLGLHYLPGGHEFMQDMDVKVHLSSNYVMYIELDICNLDIFISFMAFFTVLYIVCNVFCLCTTSILVAFWEDQRPSILSTWRRDAIGRLLQRRTMEAAMLAAQGVSAPGAVPSAAAPKEGEELHLG